MSADAEPTQGKHVAAPEDGISPYDVCEKCSKPIQLDYLYGCFVTIVGRNPECYGG